MGKSTKHTMDILNTGLYRKISQILSEEILGNNHTDVSYDPDADLVKDLGLDDLDDIEFVMCLEEEFCLPIDDEAAAKFHTLRDVYNYLLSKQTTK